MLFSPLINFVFVDEITLSDRPKGSVLFTELCITLRS